MEYRDIAKESVGIQQRRILVWRDRPPISSVCHVNEMNGFCPEGIEAYDHATAGMVLAKTGEEMPVKRGKLKQCDILITLGEETGMFDVWLVRGLDH